MNETKQTVLVTGGAGYIGSHMCVELLQNGFEIVVLDNLSNSSRRSLQAVETITQRKLTFIEGDIRDSDQLDRIFADHAITAVIHFAGLKAVGESVSEPLRYYDNNVHGTLSLVEAMRRAGVRTLVFSSSATVYGIPATVPVCEEAPTGAINPYGQTKLMVEHILEDLFRSDPTWHISILRYFNPVGAHASGEIGEDPKDIPNNLMPYISQVAVGRLEHLRVFGNDYDTPDGTGVRDYIHVVDLVRGHLAALRYLAKGPRLAIHNLGTGRGYSVLEAVRAFEAASGREIPYKIADRRPGDAGSTFADPTRARNELGWEAEYDLDRMCQDVWRWQSRHPEGYS
ncbi:MAG: UDP-glucose 4-epimerase GalE [Pseudomonadales bacterium]|nr:UDP-glucose 4-epimerase GalE [Pseudomonadales bacterium]